MHHMKRLAAVLAFLLSLSTSLVAEPIKLGLILPFTGPHAQTAEAMQNAALLAIKDLGAEAEDKIQIVFEDDGLKANLALSAFGKLTSVNKVAGVLVFGGQSVAAVAPLAAVKKVTVIAFTADSGLVQGKPCVFQHWLSSKEQSAAVFQALGSGGNVPARIALVSTTHNAALQIQQDFESMSRERGLAVVYKQDVLPSETDFRTIIMQIKAQRPDAILSVLVAPHMSLFMRQLRDSKYDIPVYSSVNAEIMDEVTAAKGAMEGVKYAGPDLSDAFIASYQENYQRYPEFAAPHVYDSVRFMAEAILSGATSGEAINQRLLSRKEFEGAMGRYGIEQGFRFNVRAVPKEIRNGAFVKSEGN